MQRISNFIFNLSPKKIAIYLVLVPLILFLAHTLTSIVFRTISTPEAINGISVQIILGILLLVLATIVLLWLFWLHSAVHSVSVSDLGIPRKWFNIALVFFIVYLLYNLCFTYIKNITEDFQYIFHALNEFIGFGGLLIAYPLLCHYAARAVTTKKSNKPATFIDALPFTLLLFFGTVLAIPFFHKYFSNKTSTNSEIIIIYAIGLALFVVILVMGFIAAITGMV